MSTIEDDNEEDDDHKDVDNDANMFETNYRPACPLCRSPASCPSHSSCPSCQKSRCCSRTSGTWPQKHQVQKNNVSK